MKIKVLNSNSAGNCYILEAENGEKLIIEAGVLMSKILKEIKFKVNTVSGCIISHEHGDHAKAANVFINYGIKTFCSRGTAEALKVRKLEIVKHGKAFRAGSYLIKPFNVEHDCNEPLGYLIHHAECGIIFFATDVKQLDGLQFRKINHFMLECNHDDYILQRNVNSGAVKSFIAERIKKSHMSITNAKKFINEYIEKNGVENIKTILLIHLSEKNAAKEAFRLEFEKLTGVATYVAVPKLEINL